MKNKKNIYKIIMLVIVVALVTFIITSTFIYNRIQGDGRSYKLLTGKNSKMYLYIEKVKKLIDEEYLGDINEEKLINGAIKGYVSGLDDEYSEYFTKDEMDEFMTSTIGNYVGIGIYMIKDQEKNEVTVLEAIKGSSAEEAGIKSGDIIKKIDDKEYTGDDFEKIPDIIKGKEGTKVKLEIERDEKTITFEVERRKVDLYPIETKVIDENIGYISLSSFDDECSKEFLKKYEELEKSNIKSLIIDLRNNGGGIVDEALEIADYILDKDQTILITKNKKGEEQIEKAKSNPKIKLPIIVLTNKNTASASEILAAALRENNKATIVGENTYGKGVIQELITLSTGAGLKITTEEYYTPNRNKINKIGIKPDYEIELPKSTENIYEVEQDDDTQLKKAIELLK